MFKTKNCNYIYQKVKVYSIYFKVCICFILCAHNMGTHPQEEVRFRQHETYSELTSVCKNTQIHTYKDTCSLDYVSM